MDFTEHLGMIGFSVNLLTQTCEMAHRDTFDQNINAVGALLNPLTSDVCVKDKHLREGFSELHRQYVSGTVSHDWGARVIDLVRQFVVEGGAYSKEFHDSFSTLSDLALAEYSSNPAVEMAEPPAPEPVKTEPVKQTAGRVSRPAGVPGTSVEGALGSKLKELGLDSEFSPAASRDPHEIAPVLLAFSQMGATDNDGVKQEMDQLRSEYFEKKIIGPKWAERAGNVISTIYQEARDKGIEAFMGSRYTTAIGATRNVAARVRPDVRTDREINAQREMVGEVMEIRKKMKAESFGPHINSSEYRNMKAAVDRVNELCKDGYDPKNPASMRKMQEALDHVNEMARQYVEKKVVGKTKKTDRGIDRKNTALALMQITDPGSVDAILDGVVDFRLDSKNDMKVDGDRKKVSFSDLMAAEKEANKRVDAGARKKKAREKAAEDVKWERFKKDSFGEGEKKVSEPLFRK